jgi:hypothetical protein
VPQAIEDKSTDRRSPKSRRAAHPVGFIHAAINMQCRSRLRSFLLFGHCHPECDWRVAADLLGKFNPPQSDIQYVPAYRASLDLRPAPDFLSFFLCEVDE